jgi:16S rRNA G966 N2-methylase RsmD
MPDVIDRFFSPNSDFLEFAYFTPIIPHTVNIIYIDPPYNSAQGYA